MEKQLIEFRRKHQDKFTQIKEPHISPNSKETRIWERDRKVKNKIFPGATIDNVYDYIRSLLKKYPDNIIVHVGTNNTTNDPSKVVLGKLLDLNKFIEKQR